MKHPGASNRGELLPALVLQWGGGVRRGGAGVVVVGEGRLARGVPCEGMQPAHGSAAERFLDLTLPHPQFSPRPLHGLNPNGSQRARELIRVIHTSWPSGEQSREGKGGKWRWGSKKTIHTAH